MGTIFIFTFSILLASTRYANSFWASNRLFNFSIFVRKFMSPFTMGFSSIDGCSIIASQLFYSAGVNAWVQ